VLRRTPREERTGSSVDLLVIGLGNPGSEYDRTKHNVGAEVVELLARRHGGSLRKAKERVRADDVRLDGKRVTLAVPMTYMNDSGAAVAPLARRSGVGPERIVIVQDELDLPTGVVRVKEGGGLAGHNGLRSIENHLHSRDFLRVRIGVNKPSDKRQGADHVLSRFSKKERDLIDVAVQDAADAVEIILREGVTAAMNRYNTRGEPDG
jgi:PTH1 family peptidyl-tRNA hydrolase